MVTQNYHYDLSTQVRHTQSSGAKLMEKILNVLNVLPLVLPKLSWTHNHFLHGASFGTIVLQNTFGNFCSMEYSKFWPVDHKKGNKCYKESSAPHTIYPEGPAAPRQLEHVREGSSSLFITPIRHRTEMPPHQERKLLTIFNWAFITDKTLWEALHIL